MNLDLFWPALSQNSNCIKRELLEKDLEQINGLSANGATGIILDESRRLYDQEQARRATIDSKAGVYIAASTALIPILISLAPVVIKLEMLLEFNILSVLNLLTIAVFMLALIMLVRCVIWSHQALKVSPFHLLSWKELLKHNNTKALQLQLVKNLLNTLRKNYDLTNDTVTCVKMAHALLTSAMFWLIVGTLIQTASYFFYGFDGIGEVPDKDSLRPIINIININHQLV